MAGRLPPILELCCPADESAPGLLARLGEHVHVVTGRSTSTDVMYLDTFDGRLRSAGLVLQRGRPGAGGRVGLTLVGADGRALRAGLVGGRADRLLAADLPEPLRTRLAPVIEDRALLPLVRVSARATAASVLDAEEKTVVRISVEAAKVHRPGHPAAPLSPRLRVVPVLGYDRDHGRIGELLRDRFELAPAEQSLIDEAVIAADGTPGGVSTKIAVELVPGTRSDLAAIAICRRLADVVDANLAGTVDDLDTEFLHDLRVSVRRTRSVLKELHGVFHPADAARARTDLRWVQEITGPTRDLDVQLAEWPEMVASLRDGAAADLEPLRLLLERHRAAAFATMRRHLRSAAFRRAWGASRELLDRPPTDLPEAIDDGRGPVDATKPDADDRPDAARPVGTVAGERVASVYGHMVREGGRIDDDSPPEDLHDLRKRGKELRYLLEMFGDLWPAETVGPMVATLKGLQDVLGRFQDDQIQATNLRAWGPELAGHPGGTDSLIALGLVIDRLATDQADARLAFAERFAPFAAEPRQVAVLETFGPAPGLPKGSKKKAKKRKHDERRP